MIKNFLCLLSIMLMSAAIADPSPVSAPVQTTPIGVVRQFLEARAAGQGDKMQALLSETTPLIPNHVGHINKDTQVFSGVLTLPQAAVISLLYDPQNKLGFTFSLLDTDPEFPNIVRVQANPVAEPPLTLQVVVEPDSSAADALRVDDLLTINCADPRVMLPIVDRLRNNTRRAASQQHLSQLGLAAIQYAQDHDEKMPDAAHWVDELMPYVKDVTLFYDPSAPISQKWGYAYNKNLSGRDFYLLDAPADTVMFFESTAGVKNASDTGQTVPVPGRYADGTDYLFGDGHVRWLPDHLRPSFVFRVAPPQPNQQPVPRKLP